MNRALLGFVLAMAGPGAFAAETPSACDPVYIYFYRGEAALSPQAIPTIAAGAKILIEKRLPAIVSGHTDGLEGDDIVLSERRAIAVKRELVRLGVKADTVETIGRGLSEPLAPIAPNIPESFNRYAVIDFCGPERFRK
jgi:OmpA-OmpF porin, OOP family